MKVTDIKWETDGYNVNLPTEVDVPDNMDDGQIADYLSDTYGWLVNSFALPFDEEKDEDSFGLYVNQVEGKVS